MSVSICVHVGVVSMSVCVCVCMHASECVCVYVRECKWVRAHMNVYKCIGKDLGTLVCTHKHIKILAFATMGLKMKMVCIY